MEVCGNIFQNIKNVLDIVSGPKAKKMTQSNLPISNSKLF